MRELAMRGQEIHAISCAAKPLSSWLARDAIQECREACGGHGYLKAAGIGSKRNDHDANCTYEGDNNILLQQTSNWLLAIWVNPKRDSLHAEYPLGTLTFLKNQNSMMASTAKFFAKSFEEITPALILNSYKWLICYLLKITTEQLKKNKKDSNNFTARNNCQVYMARTLSLAFIEHYMMEQFWEKLCQKAELSSSIRNVLVKLLLLFGLWSLEKHLGTLYQGGYAEGAMPAKVIREGVLQLCVELKGEAVALVDAIAPPDFILNSCLGKSDGQVYKHLQAAMRVKNSNGFQKEENRKESFEYLKPKL